MRARNTVFLFACVLAALPLRAADPATPWVLEQAVEATAGAVLMPSGAAGTLVVTACEGCVPQSFVTSARTRYFVAQTPVALSALRAGFAKAPATSLTVLFDGRTREVTRVIASRTLAGLVPAPQVAR